MPLERIAEYRIALPAKQAFDVIAKLGELGYVMLPPRPAELPAPHIPSEIAEAARRCDEVARELSKILSTYNVPPPEAPIEIAFTSFLDMAQKASDEGSEILTRVNQYINTINEVSQELTTFKRYLEVLERVGPVGLPEFRHFKVDLVLLEPTEVADFRKSLELHNVEVIIYEGEKPLAIVIYPTWLKETVESVYRVFNKSPIELPREQASPSAIKERVSQLEQRLQSLNSELSRYLLSIRDRLYRVTEAANAVMQIIRQYTDTVIPEGEEVRTRLNELRRGIEESKRRLEETEALLIAISSMVKRKIEKIEVATLKVRVFAVKGTLRTDVLSKYPNIVEDAGEGVKIVMIFEAPPELSPQDIISSGICVEIPREYLQDLKSALNVIAREREELKNRIRDLERELDNFVKQFNKVSVYGIENLEKAGPDTVTVIAQLRLKDVREFERALADILTKLAVHAEVRRYSKYAYIPEVPKDRAPTLETYARPIDVLKRIVYWYGIPRYGEVSPVPIAWWFFPFFYGWMFPDVGHGILIFILGALLACWKYKGSNKVLRAIFDGKRFVDWGLIFMQCGIWSIIFGFIEAGDIFGVPLRMLGVPSLYELMEPTPLRLMEEHKALTLQNLLEAIKTEGGFVPLMHSIFITLGWSIIVGIFILAASAYLKVVNYVRLGYKYDAKYYAIFGTIVLIFAFCLSSLGLVPLRPLGLTIAQQIHAHPELATPLDWAYLWFVQLVTGPLYYSGGWHMYAPMSYRLAWAIAAIVMVLVVIAVALSDKKKHAHLHEPLMTYGVEAGESYFAWGFANVISFMRLGIVAIVHAVLTALVVWGTYAIAVYAMHSWTAGLAYLVSLLPGGIIGFLVFRIFGKKFASGFLAFCLLGVVTGLAGAVLHSMSLIMIAVWICAILGNICVVIFEGLVAFIQSLRLHFYEMFTKFFIDGGILFQPFKIGSPVVRIRIV